MHQRSHPLPPSAPCNCVYIIPQHTSFGGTQAYAVSDNHWHIKCFACCMCSVALHDSPCAVHSDKKTAQTRVYCNACYKKVCDVL